MKTELNRENKRAAGGELTLMTCEAQPQTPFKTQLSVILHTHHSATCRTWHFRTCLIPEFISWSSFVPRNPGPAKLWGECLPSVWSMKLFFVTDLRLGSFQMTVGKPPNCITYNYKISNCIKEPTLINCTFIKISVPRQIFSCEDQNHLTSQNDMAFSKRWMCQRPPTQFWRATSRRGGDST